MLSCLSKKRASPVLPDSRIYNLISHCRSLVIVHSLEFRGSLVLLAMHSVFGVLPQEKIKFIKTNHVHLDGVIS